MTRSQKLRLIFLTLTKIPCKCVKMQENHKVFNQLTRVQLKHTLHWSSSCYATAAIDAFSTANVVWSSISSHFSLIASRFKSGDFMFMRDSAPCSAHQAKATQDNLRNVVPDFAVEKTSGSNAAVRKQNGH